ncbi:MAG TPA: hypothetical protein VG994_11880 [Steroidobacteraceae bacterium]|nr:hypothetical protein [Steroidobacteraceae bacterium]
MFRQALIALCGVTLIGQLSGCMVNETKPLPKINPIQAKAQIPQDELLDVGIHEFDPNIPEASANDPEALAKQRIYPDIRKAEARFIPSQLRSTLESSGQWGAVRVVPATVQFSDVAVNGTILESTGAKLAVEVSVVDSTGRAWITNKRYESPADTGSYKTDKALKARDPFQNVYSQIANDMVAFRDQLQAQNRRDIRRVTELRFAQDLAPAAMTGYLTQDPKAKTLQVARLPAKDDPYAARIERIRETDAGVVDTVNGYYANFSDAMRDSYGNWRRSSFEEIEKENRARNQARTRTFLGAAAVLASVFVPGQCNTYDYNCRRIESAARTAGAIGGTAAVLSGLKKYSDAKVHAQALKELSETFQSEVQPQVVDVEGRTLRLTGTADEQYREWQKLLHELYLEENGGDAPAGAPANAPAPTTSTTATGAPPASLKVAVEQPAPAHP